MPRPATPLRAVLKARALVALPFVLGAAIFLPGAPATQQADAATRYVYGIDVSHWQGTINWSSVSRTSVDFALAKATQGRTYNDPTYRTNRAGAKAAGIRFGAYHYASPDLSTNDAIAEADHYVNVAGLRAGNLIPALDLESTGGLTSSQLISWTKTWVRRVYARTGSKPMIYTSPNFWRYRMANTTWFANNGYRVWIAHWNVSSPTVPAYDWSGRSWSVWQYTSCGSVSGIGGCVDVDRFNGSSLRAITIGG